MPFRQRELQTTDVNAKGWYWMYDTVGKRHSVFLSGDGTVGDFGDMRPLLEQGFDFFEMTPEEADVEAGLYMENYQSHFGRITTKAKVNVERLKDQINHPEHYNTHPSGVECLTIVRHMNFNLGNVVKYIWRA